MVKFKKIVKPTVLVALFILIAVIAVGSIINSRDDARFMSSDYMESENLALDADVTIDGAKTKRLNDADASTSQSAVSGRFAIIEIDFGEVKTFNSVILKEDGLNVRRFSLQIAEEDESKEAKFKEIYRSDKIQYHRLCVFNEVKARKLRLIITDSDGGIKLKEVEVYNKGKVDREFRVSTYILDMWHQIAAKYDTYEERRAAILKDMDRYDLSKLTYIYAYCGIGITAEGTVNTGDGDIQQVVMDCLRERCHPDVKISYVIGTGAEFMRLILSDDNTRLINAMIDAANKFGFDGIDIDYEFPQTDEDFAQYDRFLIELKKAMNIGMNNKEESLLSCAFGTRDVKYSDEARASIDIVNLMTYDIMDQDGHHSDFWGSAVQGGEYMQSVGFPKEKVNIGLPFYGLPTQALAEGYDWFELDGLVDGKRNYWDNVYTVPDWKFGKPTEIALNSPAMIRDKTSYALLAGYGGIMTWHLTADVEYSDDNSLVRAIFTAVEQFGVNI